MKTRHLWSLGALLALLLAFLPLGGTAHAASYTVTNTNDSGVGSLRWAINQANGSAGLDLITFNIPGAGVHTIQPLTALPALTDDETTINGYTQAGSAPPGVGTPAVILIEIDGSLAGNVAGLTIISAHNVVRGLAINRFAVAGIAIGSFEGSDASGNSIWGNNIGTDPAGLVDLGNGFDGVYLAPGAASTWIGGPEVGHRNVLSGNGWEGVGVYGADATGNIIAGNHIGTDATGAAALANDYYGVRLYGGAHGNSVGYDAPGGTYNVISGNAWDGVRIAGAATTGNRVIRGYIGTDASGTGPLENVRSGVSIVGGAWGNFVGGNSPEAFNLISGNEYGVLVTGTATMSNTVLGNYIGPAASGMSAVGNTYGVFIADGAQRNRVGGSGDAERNLISGNEFGVVISATATTSNTVSGNWIGPDASGTGSLLQVGGVLIGDASGTTVGGSTPGERNVLSGHLGPGVYIGGPTATGNVVAGNYIGTSAAGDAGLGNEYGVLIARAAHGNIVGGGAPGEGNLISASEFGVLIQFDGTTENVVAGNTFGLDASGTVYLVNQHSVFIEGGAQSNVVGGDEAGERNVIVASAWAVEIEDSGTMSNTVSGNYIGTADGVAPMVNNIGIEIRQGAQNNLVGGDTAGERNVILGSQEHGIKISGVGTSGNVVRGNYIGTDAAGTAALGNGACGVYLEDGATENAVGPDNLVSANLAGVCMSDTNTMSNTVFGNLIGTDAAGTAPLGNTLAGVYLRGGAQHNMVGSLYYDIDRNIISGNEGSGVIISGTGTVDNVVSGNWIGPSISPSVLLGNEGNGVLIAAGAQHNTIGQYNGIAGNLLDGVVVQGEDTYGNRITWNAIFSNSMGIHLLDGANGGIAAPVITAVTMAEGSVTIEGTACASCTVEIFANPNDDGEGREWVDDPVAGPTGHFVTTVTSLPHLYLTATATDDTAGTSEFSAVYEATVSYAIYLPVVMRGAGR